MKIAFNAFGKAISVSYVLVLAAGQVSAQSSTTPDKVQPSIAALSASALRSSSLHFDRAVIGDSVALAPAAPVSSAEVKHIASKEGESLFNVVYNNPGGSRFSLSILDVEGNQLFQGVFSDRKFDKKFKIADPDVFDHLVFIIRNFTDNTSQRFEVNTNHRLIEDIEVKEVK